MDGTVRIWNLVLANATLTEHDSLVGLIALSPTFLVSPLVQIVNRVSWDPGKFKLWSDRQTHTRFVDGNQWSLASCVAAIDRSSTLMLDV